MASASNVSVNQPLTLVLLGRTGNGKSSTGNSILGRKAFHSTQSFESVTKECKMEQCTCEDGRVLNVIDTPDLFDKNASKEFLHKEVFKCIELAKDGIHGVLYVLSIKSQFTEQEADVLDNLQLELGPQILNYMVVVFTSGDAFESDGLTLQDYLNEIPQKLKRTINLCNSRMVVFNNHKSASANVKETQITELLQQVDRIVADNGPYSNDLFLKAQEMSSLLYHVKDKEKQNENDLFLKAQEISSQLYHVKDKEKQNEEQYEKEQTKLLNEMMKKNALAKAENERDLESARSAHIGAVSIIDEQSLEAKMKELEYKLELQKLETELQLERLKQKIPWRSCKIM